MGRYFIYAVLAVILFAQVSNADELSDLKKRVDPQQREINELRQGLEGLQQGGEPITMKPIFGATMSAFGDVDFSTHSRERSNNSFYFGNLVLYSAGNFSDRLTFLAEIVVANRPHGFEIDMERLLAGYTYSDLLTIRAGKHNNALGYWNRTYHHGKQFFLTVDRPFFLEFEDNGGVIPTRITGLEFEGRWGYPFARFTYVFEVGNGPRINHAAQELAANDASDDNNNKQIILRLSATPQSYPNLNLGIFGTRFAVDTASRPDMVERIYGVDIAYNHRGLELVAEYFLLDNIDATSSAFYIQLGYSPGKDVTPYLRLESLDKNGNDPYLSDLENGFDRRQFIAGVRYDIDIVRSSIKAQYRYDDTIGSGSDHHVFELQWTFSL